MHMEASLSLFTQPIIIPPKHLLPCAAAAASSRRISSTNSCFCRLLLLSNPADQSQLASHGDGAWCGRPNSRIWCLHGESLRPRNGHGSGDGDGGVDPKEAGSSEEIAAASAVMVDAFTRRFMVGTGASLLVALGGNLGGVTSFWLGINPELARRLRLDFLYPVGHFLRYLDSEKGFEFIYPESWVIDQRLLLRAIQKAESVRSLDLPAVQKNPRVSRLPTEPVVALGPPGTDGELNVSVIVAPTAPGFSIDKLGNAQQVGSFILRKFIAPEGSNKVAFEIDARERQESLGKAKISYYVLEYSIKAPTFYRHNVAVYTSYNGQLFSLNAQSPQALWARNKDDFLRIADSFRLLI